MNIFNVRCTYVVAQNQAFPSFPYLLQTDKDVLKVPRSKFCCLGHRQRIFYSNKITPSILNTVELLINLTLFIHQINEIK